MFLLGISQDYSLGIFNIVAAVWFMAVGYLLLKNVNRRMRASAVRLAARVPAESILDGHRSLQRGLTGNAYPGM